MRVNKEFWVSDDFIKIMDESTRLVSESVTDWVFNCPIQKIYTGDARSKHKITISYEVDREVTIKESDLENALKDINIHGHSLIELGVMDKVKRKLFGGEIK